MEPEHSNTSAEQVLPNSPQTPRHIQSSVEIHSHRRLHILIAILITAAIVSSYFIYKQLYPYNQTTEKQLTENKHPMQASPTLTLPTESPELPTPTPISFQELPPTTTPGYLLYQDINLGYAFEYPQDQTIKPGPYTIFLENLGFALYQIDINEENPQADLIHNSLNVCAADGPNSTIYSNTESIRIEPYTNPQNVHGFQLSFTCNGEIYNPPSIQTKDNIVYAYHLPHTKDKYIMIYMYSIFEKYNPKELITIADSFILLPKSN